MPARAFGRPSRGRTNRARLVRRRIHNFFSRICTRGRHGRHTVASNIEQHGDLRRFAARRVRVVVGDAVFGTFQQWVGHVRVAQSAVVGIKCRTRSRRRYVSGGGEWPACLGPVFSLSVTCALPYMCLHSFGTAGAPSDRFGGFGGVVNRAAPSNSLSDHSSSLTPAAGTPTILPAYLTSTISSFTSTSLSNSAPLEFAPKPQSMSQSSSRPESQTQPRSSLLSGAISATRAQPVGATAASSASDLNQPEPDMDEDASQYGSSVTISFFQSSRSGSAANGASALASTGQVSALVFDNGAADEDEVSGAQSASARKRPGSGRVYSKHQLHLMEEQDAAEEAGGGGGAVAGAGSRRSTQKAPHSYSSFAAMSGGFGSSKASPAFQPSAGDAGADAGAGAESEAGAGGMAGGARMAHLQLPTPHHHPSFSSSSSSVSSAAAAAAYRRSLYAAVVSPSDVGGVVFTPRDATVREPDPASAATNGPASSSSSSSSPALEAVTVQLPAAHEPLVLRLTDLPAWATASNQKHLLDRQNSRCAECQRPLVARLFAWNSLASPQFCHYTGMCCAGSGAAG